MPKEQDIQSRLRELTHDVRELRREIEGFRRPGEHTLARANDERLPRRATQSPASPGTDRKLR